MEAQNLPKALQVVNQGFLYNGLEHQNIISFLGCYLSEIHMLELESEHEACINGASPEDAKVEKDAFKRNKTYQIGLITKHFT